jgi:SAM-dependent methyltransferase
MPADLHQAVVNQFGPRADAYVSSKVHAAGPDLTAMVAHLQSAPVADLLDLGCGGGHVSLHAAPLVGQVTAYDLSEAMLSAVGRTAEGRGLRNISLRQGSAESLPFPDASFDRVISRYSAHHWLDVPVALNEVRRVLRPDGLLVMMDVFAPAHPLLDSYLQTIEMLRDPSHVRDYSLRDWNAMLNDAGFAPGPAQCWRLHLEFQSWVERINTPKPHIPALLSLQNAAAAEVKSHFEIQSDGSFTLDTMSILARPR